MFSNTAKAVVLLLSVVVVFILHGTFSNHGRLGSRLCRYCDAELSFGVCSTESAPIQIACEDYNALCIQLIVIMAEQVTYSHTLFKTEHSILTRHFFLDQPIKISARKPFSAGFFGSRELSRLDNSRDRADPISGQLYFPVFTKLFLIGE